MWIGGDRGRERERVWRMITHLATATGSNHSNTRNLIACLWHISLLLEAQYLSEEFNAISRNWKYFHMYIFKPKLQTYLSGPRKDKSRTFFFVHWNRNSDRTSTIVCVCVCIHRFLYIEKRGSPDHYTAVCRLYFCLFLCQQHHRIYSIVILTTVGVFHIHNVLEQKKNIFPRYSIEFERLNRAYGDHKLFWLSFSWHLRYAPILLLLLFHCCWQMILCTNASTVILDLLLSLHLGISWNPKNVFMWCLLQHCQPAVLHKCYHMWNWWINGSRFFSNENLFLHTINRYSEQWIVHMKQTNR